MQNLERILGMCSPERGSAPCGRANEPLRVMREVPGSVADQTPEIVRNRLACHNLGLMYTCATHYCALGLGVKALSAIANLSCEA